MTAPHGGARRPVQPARGMEDALSEEQIDKWKSELSELVLATGRQSVSDAHEVAVALARTAYAATNNPASTDILIAICALEARDYGRAAEMLRTVRVHERTQDHQAARDTVKSASLAVFHWNKCVRREELRLLLAESIP